jgi:Carboxypeptidase regulatory-like domain
MKTRFSVALALALLFGVGVVSLAWAQDDDEGPVSSVHFVVVRDSDGKPLRNAQVVLHPVNRKGKQAQGEMDLKTDAEGKASMDGIPYGALRVQVLAPHFQTFGEDYEIDKAEVQITVKLKHPGDQYSIYDDKKPQ